MNEQHDNPDERDHAEQRDARAKQSEAPRTDQRASHVSSTDAQYGTHSSAGSTPHANADPARSGARQPTRGGAQTGLTGSVGQLDSEAENIQRPGGANPSAQSSTDWQVQRGDEGNLPDVASEQARAAAADPGRVTQDQGGGMTIDRGEEGNLDQARSMQGSAPERTTYPGQGPGEAHGDSKYNASANEQDALSQRMGGESLRDDDSEDSEGSEAERDGPTRSQRQQQR